MKTQLKWIDGMFLQAAADQNQVGMDAKAPIGHNKAMTPKELVAAGLGGCTAMDVIALLKKHKQAFESLEMNVEIETSTGVYPAVFNKAELTYFVTGPVEAKILSEAVMLSQTKYCGVSKMLSQAFPITYKVMLNGEQVSQGAAEFSAE